MIVFIFKVTATDKQVTAYLARYESRLAGKNLVYNYFDLFIMARYLKQILMILKAFIACLSSTGTTAYSLAFHSKMH